MTSRLFDQLRKPDSMLQVLLESVSMHDSVAAAEARLASGFAMVLVVSSTRLAHVSLQALIC